MPEWDLMSSRMTSSIGSLAGSGLDWCSDSRTVDRLSEERRKDLLETRHRS
jgi:hypothetical protein